MVAKFPSTVKANNWLMPHQSHFSWTKHWIVPCHISKQLCDTGYTIAQSGASYEQLLATEYEKHPEYYFTPKEFSQKIFGAEDSTITKDPNYLQFIKEKANAIVNNEHIELSDEQASAVVIISDENSIDSHLQKKMMDFLMQGTPKSKQFAMIVNGTQNITQYLTHVTDDQSNNKSQAIKAHSADYKKAIFTRCHQYLAIKNPSKKDKEKFIGSVKNAEKKFEKSALNIDRGIMRKAMQIMVNLLLHVTGLFVIANTLNKAITGDWRFLKKTSSTKKINEEVNSIIKITQTSPEKKQVSKSQQMREEIQKVKNNGCESDALDSTSVKPP